MSDTERDEGAINDFLLQLAEDRAAGREHDLGHYLALFPGFEAAITLEWSAIELAAEEDDEPREERIGPYRILEELGRGGQGIVYRAADTRLPRVVALKVLRSPVLLAQDGVLARFQREADALSRLDHPNISSVIDVGREGDVAYLAMRFVPGKTLRQLLDAQREERMASGADDSSTSGSRSSRQAVKERVELIETCARAVHAAHRSGIIHRDLKPANVMIDEDGRPVLLDFGLARDTEEETFLTGTGDVLGTPAYMSPEQVEGRRVDVATDVWSLGVMLFETLTHHHPFEAEPSHRTPSTRVAGTRAELFQAIRLQPPLDPRRFDRGISRDLKVVIEAAIDKDPARRYATAEAFADDLRRVIEDRPVTARRASAFTRGMRWGRRHPAGAAALALTAFVLPVIGFLFATIQENRKDVEAAREQRLLVEYEDRVTSGLWEFEHGDRERGIALLTSGAEQKPRRPEAWVGLTLAHARVGRHHEAGRALEALQGVLSDPGAIEILQSELRDLERQAPPVIRESSEHPVTQTGWFVRGTVFMNRAHRMIEPPVVFAEEARRAFLIAVLGATRSNKVFLHALAHATGHLPKEQVDPAEVLALSRTLRGLWPEDIDTNHMAGFVLKSTDRREAFLQFERLLALARRRGAPIRHLHTLLGDLLRYEDPKRARDLCMQTLELFPENVVALNTLATMAHEQGNPEEAIRWARRAGPGARTEAERFRVAITLGRVGAYEESERLLRELRAARPHEPRITFELAVTLHGARKRNEAFELLQEVVSVGEERGVAPRILAEAHSMIAGDLIDAGKPKAAERQARAGVARDPGNQNCLSFLASLRVDADPLEARQLATRLLEVADARDWPIPRSRALLVVEILDERDPAREAGGHFDELVALLVRRPDVLGGALDALKPIKRSRAFRTRLLEKLIAVRHDHEPALSKRAGDLVRSDPVRALELFERASKLTDRAGPLFQIAHLRMQRGETRAAELGNREGLKRNPRDPQGWCNLGHALRATGRPREALRCFQRGREFANAIRNFNPPVDQWIAAAQRNVETLESLEPRWKELMEVEDLEPHESEAIALAQRLLAITCPARSLALWNRLRARDEGLELTHARFIAGAALQLSRCPTGIGGTSTDAGELRREGLSILEEALEHLLATEKDRKRVAAELRLWLRDAFSFWSFRNQTALAALGDEKEARAWNRLWGRVTRAAR